MCLLIDGTLLSLSTNFIVQWFAIFNALLFKVWSLYQQQQQHLGNLLETKSAAATATDLLNLGVVAGGGVSAVCVYQALGDSGQSSRLGTTALAWFADGKSPSKSVLKCKSPTLSLQNWILQIWVQDPATHMICQDSRIKMAPFNFEKPYRSLLATEACTPYGHISHRSAKTPVFSPRL